MSEKKVAASVSRTKPLGPCQIGTATVNAGYLTIDEQSSGKRVALVEFRDYPGGRLRQAYENAKLFSAAPAMRDALAAEDHFRTRGYSKTVVWEFAGKDPEHPIWMAFCINGFTEVRRYLDELRSKALASARFP